MRSQVNARDCVIARLNCSAQKVVRHNNVPGNELRLERGDEVWLFALRCGELAEDRVATAAMMNDVELWQSQ